MNDLAKVCGDICEACSKECEKFDYDFSKRCGLSCDKCAKLCHDMSEITVSA